MSVCLPRPLHSMLLMLLGMQVCCMQPPDLRAVRKRFHLDGLVQIHHVYPRQFRNHPALEDFHVDSPENLVLMPTRRASESICLRKDRLIHDGGHPSYNRYVGKYLETVMHLPPELRQKHILQTLLVLQKEMRHHTFVPWD